MVTSRSSIRSHLGKQCLNGRHESGFGLVLLSIYKELKLITREKNGLGLVTF